MSNTILVLGSTGKTGVRVAERLTRQGISFLSGSRKGSPSFDWENPDNWRELLTDIDSVYISFQPDLAVPGAAEKITQLVEIAKQTQVRKLVLLSGRGEKGAEVCEQVIIQSGLQWAIIRSSWFMQNFSESFLLQPIIDNEMVLPAVKVTEPFIDLDDLADIIVKVLLDDHFNGHIYEITGPELLSFRTATEIIASATHRKITYQEMEPDAYNDLLRSFQVPEDYIWLIHYLFSEVLDGRNESLTTDAQKILQRMPTTFQQYVDKTKKTGVWEK